MPKSVEKCVTAVKKLVKKGKISRTYINKDEKRVKTNPYAICYANKKNKRR